MAIMSMYEEWGFRVSKAEMMLILKALGGRLKEDELPAAKELGDRLTVSRIKEMEHVTETLRKSLREAGVEFG